MINISQKSLRATIIEELIRLDLIVEPPDDIRIFVKKPDIKSVVEPEL